MKSNRSTRERERESGNSRPFPFPSAILVSSHAGKRKFWRTFSWRTHPIDASSSLCASRRQNRVLCVRVISQLKFFVRSLCFFHPLTFPPSVPILPHSPWDHQQRLKKGRDDLSLQLPLSSIITPQDDAPSSSSGDGENEPLTSPKVCSY